MSSTTTSDAMNTNLSAKAKKNKKRKSGKHKINGEVTRPNGIKDEEEHEDGAEELETVSRTPTEPPTPTSPRKPEIMNLSAPTKGIPVALNGVTSTTNGMTTDSTSADQASRLRASSRQESRSQHLSSEGDGHHSEAPSEHSEVNLNALVKEREELREEVTQVRKAIQELQERHDAEIKTIREQIDDTREEKEQAESQYRNLLGKVNTIRSQLGDRLKADAEDLSQARTRIEELEEQNRSLREQNETREAELASLAEQGEQQSKELSGLRNRTTLSQQNFSKEREDLLQREAYAKEEFEAAKQAMQDWEILAMEERSIRESVAEKLTDLEEQVNSHREAYEKAASERDSQSSTVNGLQRALQELQDARRRELREMVENSQTQVESLQKQLRESESQAKETSSALEITRVELDRALPFEKEVKEKNLLIGKLRHEAVILNDHLTKALRYLKRGKNEDNIDKQLITNHFIHFLALERSDPKKFQVLQIIASLLAWSDEQREQAGLARPGASNPNLRVPVSPWHRTPSTPALSSDFSFDNSSRKESLAELWSDFLEQEAQEGIKSPKSPSSSAALSSSASSRPS